MFARKVSSEPQYRLDFEERPNYFYARIECGDLELTTCKAIVLQTVEGLRRSGRNKLLVELVVGERLSLADTFWLGFYYSNLLSKDDKVAVVDAEPDHEIHNRFADTAAQHLEVKRRSFPSVDEAEEWLASD